MSRLIPVLLHTLAVVVALAVAYVLVLLLGIENPAVATVVGLVAVALEKLVRTDKDWVNRN